MHTLQTIHTIDPIEPVDKLIAEYIMGWTKPNQAATHYVDKQGIQHESFHPSSNIQDAWFVAQTVCDRNDWRIVIDASIDTTQVNFKSKLGGDRQLFGLRETTPLAICEACLDSIGVSIDDLLDRKE